MASGLKVGIAFCDYFSDLLSAGAEIDYVETPYELLRSNPAVFDALDGTPVILHCASLSMAGTVPPDASVCDDVARWALLTKTPWVGEHLSFISADSGLDRIADEYAPGEPYNIGYTVSPAYCEETVAIVSESVKRCRQVLNVPLILENAPIYVPSPLSNMSPSQFINELCDSSDVGLLFDAAHWFITCSTLGIDPFEEMRRLPLRRVIEAHVSGIEVQQDMCFDNHASTAPDVVLRLLADVCQRADNLAAVTLEYNWASTIPIEQLCREIGRVRNAISRSFALGSV